MLTAFTNAAIFTGRGISQGQALLIEDGHIRALTEIESLPADTELIDCGGHYLAPGLLDLQIYGAGGHLFSNHPTPEALEAVAEAIVLTGTTGFMLTLATNPMEIVYEAIRVAGEHPHPALLGLHLEGPYISTAKRGAHPEAYVRRPERKELETLLKAGRGIVKMMTIAPECWEPELISLLTDYGVVVSAGHSNATFAEAMKGYAAGIRTTTHLFNAMSPFHHRDTGLPGAAFRSGTAFASIIADGIHVDYNALAVSKALLQDRLFLITDAVAETREGFYIHVRQKDRYTLPDGTLSGSALTLLQAVSNCVEHAGIALPEALRMATVYPAAVIGSADRGALEPGCRADLILFDRNMALSGVCFGGAFRRC
ncbi:N-acetylglucosamine-6-phosphate deacetylase [Compostibacter hankyongensis]|uniref:N-acetylglucosamine-6-phosphate deacetylase n=1 Tax=Compostibacter hankyongensis TaxID=1007089 RepID=A0ABP8FDQ2_9BACT